MLRAENQDIRRCKLHQIPFLYLRLASYNNENNFFKIKIITNTCISHKYSTSILFKFVSH